MAEGDVERVVSVLAEGGEKIEGYILPPEGDPGGFFVGDIKHSGRTADHGRWLICDGRAISRTIEYADLFDVIGTIFGVGDGSTTFNIPTDTHPTNANIIIFIAY